MSAEVRSLLVNNIVQNKISQIYIQYVPFFGSQHVTLISMAIIKYEARAYA